jgi:hypothetical protein
MAFGYESPVTGYAGSPWMAARSGTTPILEFYRHYFKRFYTGTRTVADVAVLRNWPSMAYSINAAYVPATLMEQVLIQHKIPFDLLFDEELTNLDRYQSVILAGQECVADDQAKLLLDYVRRGGTLVITDNTAEYNGWREKRRVNPFLPVAPKPAAAGEGWTARGEGKGRIVYIKQIVPDVKLEKGQVGADNPEPGPASLQTPKMSPPQWLLPKNHQEICDAIVTNLPNGLSLTGAAPLTTVTELIARPETRETLVHFVNFDRPHPLAPFKVTVRKQFNGPVKSVTAFSPDADEPQPVQFGTSGDFVTFTAPAMRIYSMVVIAQGEGK